MMIDTILLILTIGFVLTILFFYRGFLRLNRQKRTAAKLAVSVIVCAHNEEKNLPDCLKRLARQNYPGEKIEFIIVNDRSTDRTPQIIHQYASKDTRFKAVAINDRIPDFAPKKRAIHTALQQARGEIILLTDADGRPGYRWVETMVSYFTDDTHMVIGYAPYRIKPARHFVKRLLALEYLSHAAIAAASTGLGWPLTCVGTNMAYRKTLYEEVGGFGPYKAHLSGDDDLFLTLVREAGKYKIKYANDAHAHVFNNPPRLWSKFLHQRLRYASKGFDYPAKVTIGLILYYLFNLLLAGKTVYSLATFSISGGFLLIWTLKMGGEFLFMNKAARTLKDLRSLVVFPIVSFLHPFYVVLFGALGQLGYFQWAENKIEAAVQKPVTNKD
ncbi:glycosyltransferase [Calditrichota bacterium GD2]